LDLYYCKKAFLIVEILVMSKAPMLTLQYLEYSPLLDQLDENKVVERLRAAYERLPFSHLLIGWCLPPRLLDLCRAEAERLGIRFLRWHPLLTGDGVFQPRLAWQVSGATGQVIRGYEDRPEFTFVCPNNPDVQEAVSTRLQRLNQHGHYQGFFLDRVRFPSPTADPVRDLGCFCEHCRRKAADFGLDLGQIQSVILERTREEDGRVSLVQALLGAKGGYADEALIASLQPLLEFRCRSVSDFVAMIAARLNDAHMEIGLDCFSPGLTRMVGQDLESLSAHVNWIKLMTYAHTCAPAGLPFELSRMLDYLVTTTRFKPAEALSLISASLGLPLPSTREALVKDGLSPQALMSEVRRGVESCKPPVLAGVELVDLGISLQLRQFQITTDLEALRGSGAAGLALSWDLLYMPLEWLSLVNQVYGVV
jgi:hypothetical protein